MSEDNAPTWRDWLGLYADAFGILGGVVLVVSILSIFAGWLFWPWFVIPLTAATTVLCIYIVGRVFISNNAPLKTLGRIEQGQEPTPLASVLQIADPSPVLEVRHEVKPDLKGTILCMKTEFAMNTWQDRIMAGNKWYEEGHDCAITLNVRITTDSPAPMTVTSFNLFLIGLESLLMCGRSATWSRH